jgi:hypothetical protein
LISLCRGHGLTNLYGSVLIPIMLPAMSNQDCALRFNFLDQVTPLHASSSSEC